jgi:ubiquinone/menaquinone biosynthesis C-methylase UbiE
VGQLIVGEILCEEVGLTAGARVLDVACGSGNTSLAAARRMARVSGVDIVPALLERARRRAEVEGLELDLKEGDAQALPTMRPASMWFYQRSAPCSPLTRSVPPQSCSECAGQAE